MSISNSIHPLRSGICYLNLDIDTSTEIRLKVCWWIIFCNSSTHGSLTPEHHFTHDRVYFKSLKILTPEHGSLTPEHRFMCEIVGSHRGNQCPSELYKCRVVYIFDVAANKNFEMWNMMICWGKLERWVDWLMLGEVLVDYMHVSLNRHEFIRR